LDYEADKVDDLHHPNAGNLSSNCPEQQAEELARKTDRVVLQA